MSAVEKSVAALDDAMLCELEAELMREFKAGRNDGEWLIACRFEMAGRFTAEAQRARSDAKEEGKEP